MLNRSEMESRVARGLATALLVVLLLAGFAGALEGLAALVLGSVPLAEDEGYLARSRHRHCQFGWEHPAARCDPSRVSAADGISILAIGGSNVMDFWGRRSHFPVVLQGLLDAAAPGAYDVVNMGRVCKDSTYVRRCAEFAALAAPDAIVLYTGHNDYANWGFVNPQRRIFLEDHAWYYDWEESLARSRLFSLLARRLAGGAAGPVAIPLSLTEAQVEAGSAVIVERFTRNMERLFGLAEAQGSEVYLVTVVSNLAEHPLRRERWDEPLFTSEPNERRRRWGESYRQAIRLFRAGRFDASLGAFQRARDLDPDGRARTELNERIRELAARHAHVHLIDLERRLHRVGLEVGIGCNYFGEGGRCDQFHMNAQVHQMLAQMLVRAIARQHPAP